MIIHVHDIFLPWEYPKSWVLQGICWSEQYLVRSVLSFNQSFEVLLAMYWMGREHPELISQAVDGYVADRHRGTSLWLWRTR